MPRVALPLSPINNLAIVRSTRTGRLGLVLGLEPYWHGGALHPDNFLCWTYSVWYPNDRAHTGLVGPAAIEVVHNEEEVDLAIARIKATPEVDPMQQGLVLVNNVDVEEDEDRFNLCLVPVPAGGPWRSTILEAWRNNQLLETNLDAVGTRGGDGEQDEDASLEFSYVDGLPWLEPAAGTLR